MKSGIAILAAAGAMLAAFPAQAQTAAQGATVFKTKCGICHSVEPGKKGVGPNLHGIVGQQAGAVPGYAFSPAMKKAGKWTPERLDAYLANPKATVPGNKMTFAGLPKPEDRAAVIAFLKAN